LAGCEAPTATSADEHRRAAGGDLADPLRQLAERDVDRALEVPGVEFVILADVDEGRRAGALAQQRRELGGGEPTHAGRGGRTWGRRRIPWLRDRGVVAAHRAVAPTRNPELIEARSEEHTSELQSPCKLVCR